MKFGGVILCQKLHQEIIKHLKRHEYDVFMTSSCILGSVRVEKVENRNFFVFSFDFLEIWYRGNFEMLITKRGPKLKLENDLSKKLQFSTDFRQNDNKHSSTISTGLFILEIRTY